MAVVFLPLLGAAIAGFFGRLIGDRASQLVTCGAMVLSAAIAIPMFREVLEQSGPQVVPLATWIVAGGGNVEWALRLGNLAGGVLTPRSCLSARIPVSST